LRIHSTRAASDFARLPRFSGLALLHSQERLTISQQGLGAARRAESMTPRSLMISTSCSARSSIALDPALFVAAQNVLRAVLSGDVTKPESRSSFSRRS
jgi:hypothetical protein